VFPVLQLTLPFIRDAKRLLRALAGLGYGKEKIRLLVNRVDRRSVISFDDAARSLGYPVFEAIPNSYAAVSRSVDQGVPILELAMHDPACKALLELAGRLAPVRKEGGRWFRTLWSGR
jgi:pilus assembly protein CpaE